jgi:hypothetical protein
MLMHAKYNNNSPEKNSGSYSNNGAGGGGDHSSGRKSSNGDPFNVHNDDGVQLIGSGGLDHENNPQHMLEPLLH